MNFEQVIASFGLGGLVADEFFVTQIGVLTLTAILFAASLALCIMAARAASTAKRVRDDVQSSAASMQDMAVEMRQLTAQVERASYAQSHVDHEDDATEANDETSLDSYADETNPPTEGNHKRSRPSALLRGFLSRR